MAPTDPTAIIARYSRPGVPIEPDTLLSDLMHPMGIDRVYSLPLDLDEAFDIIIPCSEAAHWRTVADVVACVDRMAGRVGV